MNESKNGWNEIKSAIVEVTGLVWMEMESVGIVGMANICLSKQE